MGIYLEVCREEAYDLERDACTRSQHKQNTHEVDEPRPDHSMSRFHRACVNYGGYRIRGVVKAIHKLKAKRNRKTNNKNNERRNFHQIISVLCTDSLSPEFC